MHTTSSLVIPKLSANLLTALLLEDAFYIISKLFLPELTICKCSPKALVISSLASFKDSKSYLQ